MSVHSWDSPMGSSGSGLPVPAGGIIAWTGASVPDGWGLCDGSNGTPDLRDKFIAGAALGAAASGGTQLPGAAPNAHSAHAVTQPNAHSAHAVTQPNAHSAHAVTQPNNHPVNIDDHNASAVVVGAGTGRAFTAAGDVVHSGTTTLVHAGAAVDAHSAHAGAAVDAHSAHAGAAVDAHSAHETPSYYKLAFIMRLA